MGNFNYHKHYKTWLRHPSAWNSPVFRVNRNTQNIFQTPEAAFQIYLYNMMRNSQNKGSSSMVGLQTKGEKQTNKQTKTKKYMTVFWQTMLILKSLKCTRTTGKNRIFLRKKMKFCRFLLKFVKFCENKRHIFWYFVTQSLHFYSLFLKQCVFHMGPAGGGVLTDKWYIGMLKGFEVHFRKFWYIDGWVIVTYPMRPICKIGCILENLAKRAPNLLFCRQNGIEMGHKITLFEV